MDTITVPIYPTTQPPTQKNWVPITVAAGIGILAIIGIVASIKK
jgi:hypothetical protein